MCRLADAAETPDPDEPKTACLIHMEDAITTEAKAIATNNELSLIFMKCSRLKPLVWITPALTEASKSVEVEKPESDTMVAERTSDD